MKRVLVTGARGLIGSHCLTPLRAAGYDVHALSRHPVASAEGSVCWHQADLLDPSSLNPLLEQVRPTHLLHLAWCVVPGVSISSDENYDWVMASLALARRFADLGGHRLVAGGSGYEYNWRYGYCSEALTPLIPDTVYGACKHALHVMLQQCAAALPLGFAWPRIFFVYGPNEHPDRLVSYVVRSLLAQTPARCSHGLQIRDYLHVQDVADALVALLDSDVMGPINIASGTPVTLGKIVQTIARILDRESLLELGAIPSRPNDAPLVVGSVERLHTALQWRPRYDLETGLTHTIDWWRSRSAVASTQAT